MINCTVCNTKNHHLATVCICCGSFIQNKVNNLDLFKTIWKLIETPKEAFYEIAISNHKNYTIFLSGLFGIGLIFCLFWFFKLGNKIDSILVLLIGGFSLGPFLGVFCVFIFSILFILFTRIVKWNCTFKNVYAITSYSLIPVVFSVVFVLPLELALFGLYFFSSNPSPTILKPTFYYILLTLDVILCGWSFVLLNYGIKILLDISWIKALSVSLAIVFVLVISFILLQQHVV